MECILKIFGIIISFLPNMMCSIKYKYLQTNKYEWLPTTVVSVYIRDPNFGAVGFLSVPSAIRNTTEISHASTVGVLLHLRNTNIQNIKSNPTSILKFLILISFCIAIRVVKHLRSTYLQNIYSNCTFNFKYFKYIFTRIRTFQCCKQT